VPFSAWLYRIASNQVAQHFRDTKKDRTVSIEEQNLTDLAEEIKTTDNEKLRALLIRSLEDLKPLDLSLIELRFFEQRPFKEIANLLEITESNAKVKTYRTPNSVEGTPRYRWIYPVLAMAAAGLVGVVMMILNPAPKADSAAEAKAYFASQPFINPPIKTLKPTYQEQSVDANKGGTYIYENGSTVVVPPSAFINGQGGLVEGSVEIKYREFHDYVDFFISGIPMDYDSMGTRYQLESAGMVEIYAEQNGERLKMNPSTSIA